MAQLASDLSSPNLQATEVLEKGPDTGEGALSLLDIISDNNPSARKLTEALEQKDELSRFRGAWQILADKQPGEISEITRQTRQETGKSFDELAFKQLSPEHAKRLLKMVSEKSVSEIPEANKREASDLIKESSGLETGKLNTVTLPDGRSYDVYIPKTVHAFNEDGQLKIPTIAAIHGAVPGFNEFRHQKDATGLNLVADQLGIAVIYPKAAARRFDGTQYDETLTSHLGRLGRYLDKQLNYRPVYAWNTGDHDLMPSEKSYSDYDYMNRALADLGSKINISSQIGIVGHSDGGRFGQNFTREFPGKVAAIATITSTWMKGSAEPKDGKPFWAVLSGNDNVLPPEGGSGVKGRYLYDLFLPSKAADSRPQMQEQVWAKASKCEGAVEVDKDGIHRKQYSGRNCDVRVDLVKNSGHTVPDWRNLQETHYQYKIFKTVVNHEHNYSHDMAAWLKEKIIKKH